MKALTTLLSVVSALGILYFVVDTWRSLGDIDVILGDPRVLITALIVTVVPLAVSWGGIWWVSQAQSTKGFFIKLLSSSAIAWAWLFAGSIFLALLRFQ